MTYVYKIMVSLTLCRFLDHPVENKALNKFTDWLTMFFLFFSYTYVSPTVYTFYSVFHFFQKWIIRTKYRTDGEDVDFAEVHLVVGQWKLDNDVFEVKCTLTDVRALHGDRGSTGHVTWVLAADRVVPQLHHVIV